VTLRLLSVSFEELRFFAVTDDASRFVTVTTGSGRDWLRGVHFPNLRDGGETLGNDELDEEVRIRASEELARLQGAVFAAARYREFAA
jgi:hypothetical protein